MDAASDPNIPEVVLMTSAQVGKTSIIENIIGYHIHQDPAPILNVQPTLEMAETFSKDRLAPMLRDTPVLRERVAKIRSRDSGNTLLHKQFPGGHITITGANSPSGLAARPIRLVLADEIDRFPPSAGTEGDPVSLAKKRTRTFWNRKVVLCSTPTIKGFSRIELAYNQSDQRHYHVPCPECGEYQVLKWANIHWDKDGKRHIPESAVYVCDRCGAILEEKHKAEMLAKGRWVADEPFSGVAGFHLNELYSPWSTWCDVVREFLRAKQNPETLKTWVNTSLGETWEDEGQTIDSGALFGRRERYTELPEEVLVLVAGIDVQDNRIELEIVGYGLGEESWGVGYHVVWGNPAFAQVWSDLEDVLATQYKRTDGVMLSVAAAGIDTGGHYTQATYEWVRKMGGRVFALKGVAGWGRPAVSSVMHKRSGRDGRKVMLFQVGVDDIKSVWYSRFEVDTPGPGYCHFPMSYDENYFSQLTAEKIVTKYVKGFPRREWVQFRDRNEALDCRVYSLAALRILNPVWHRLDSRLRPQPAPETPRVEMPAIRRKRAGTNQSYVMRW